MTDLPSPDKRALVALGLVVATAGAGGFLVWLFRQKPLRVALVGDSLAVGLGAAMAAQKGATPMQYQGIVSSTPLQWSQHAAFCGSCGDWLAGFGPSVILVCLGTNDIGYSPAPPIAPYLALVAKWSAIAPVVWIDPPMMPNDRLSGVRGVIAQLGVPVFPAERGLPFGADGIHPTSYAPWARDVWKALR